MAKLVDANRAKEFAQSFLADPILRMAVNSVVDNCPGFELVRCKDCKNYDTEGYCWYWDYETGMSPNEVDPDDFCSYGERRTDGK